MFVALVVFFLRPIQSLFVEKETSKRNNALIFTDDQRRSAKNYQLLIILFRLMTVAQWSPCGGRNGGAVTFTIKWQMQFMQFFPKLPVPCDFAIFSWVDYGLTQCQPTIPPSLLTSCSAGYCNFCQTS